MPKISPKNDLAVLKAMARTISKADAAKIVKTVGGQNGTVNTKTELAQLKAIREKYGTAFSADAKKLIDSEIKSASKTVKATGSGNLGWSTGGAGDSGPLRRTGSVGSSSGAGGGGS